MTQYCLYKATSPSGKVYVGITNNFKRRMKEHRTSKYPFGAALRKYGIDSFVFEFELFEWVEDALAREQELANLDTLDKEKMYNISVGGIFANVLKDQNPMKNKDVVDKHPNVWRKGSKNNPILNPEIKEKMIKSQKCKKVSIDGVIYYGVREAARQLSISRQLVVYRLKAKSFDTWFYVKEQ